MKKLITLGIVLLFALYASAQEANAIVGKWLTQDGDSHVEIYAKGDKYFGKIVWLKNPKNDSGQNKIDDKNPDPKLASRSIMGLPLLNTFVFDDGEWEDGTIYDPKSGKTYSCVIVMKDPNTIEVTGYVGFSFIGKTVVWTKAK